MFDPELPPARLTSTSPREALLCHARHHGAIALRVGLRLCFHLSTALLAFFSVLYLAFRLVTL